MSRHRRPAANASRKIPTSTTGASMQEHTANWSIPAIEIVRQHICTFADYYPATDSLFACCIRPCLSYSMDSLYPGTLLHLTHAHLFCRLPLIVLH